MLKFVLFAFLSCGMVTTASAMSVWIVEPGLFPGSNEAIISASDFGSAFVASLAALCSLAGTFYAALKN
jgi:superfamily II helicase